MTQASIKAAFNEVLSLTDKLDALINNAAILLNEDQSLLTQSPEFITKVLHTNSIAALMMVQAFRPMMVSGSQVLFMSSGGGSMSDPVGGWAPVYCISKTLLNSICRHLAFELRGVGVAVNAVCPGWVRTDMGGAGAPRSVTEGCTDSSLVDTRRPKREDRTCCGVTKR